MIRGGGQAAIRAAAEHEWHGVILDQLVRDVVGRFDPGRAGVVVVKLPSGELATRVESAFYFDEARRAEIGPGEFLFARPNEFDGTVGGFRKTRGLDGGVARMFAAVGRTGIGHDDTDTA